MDSKCSERLREAKIKLIISHPFFGTLATGLNHIVDNKMSTAATDGKNLFYNEEFILCLNKKELLYLYAHEVLHNVFEHHYRRNKRHALIWNIACDYAINLILKDECIGCPPNLKKGGVLLDEKYRGMSAEEIYDIISEEVKSSEELQNLVDRLLDEHPDFTNQKSPEEIEEIKAKMKEDLLKASQVCGAGNVPMGVDRYIKLITEPKLNWKDIIRQNISSLIINNYSFFKFNKKSCYCQNGFILPGSLKQEKIKLAIALDMSGSISDEDAMSFISEIAGIMCQFEDYELDVWCFDTQTYSHEKFSPYNSSDISLYTPKGGGGTSFECNWSFMKKNEIKPELFVMFTDMIPCGGWGDPVYCDTIFVSHKSNGIKAPFGLTVEMN